MRESRLSFGTVTERHCLRPKEEDNRSGKEGRKLPTWKRCLEDDATQEEGNVPQFAIHCCNLEPPPLQRDGGMEATTSTRLSALTIEHITKGGHHRPSREARCQLPTKEEDKRAPPVICHDNRETLPLLKLK